MIFYQCHDCKGQFKGHLLQDECKYCKSTNIEKLGFRNYEKKEKSLKEKKK
jgi:hypothetical protein